MTRERAHEWALDPRGPGSPEEREAFELWLDRDAELRALAEEQRALFAALDDWAPPEPSHDFDRRVWARIAANPAPERRFGWPAAWAAAAMAAVVAGATWLSPAPSPVAESPASASADIVHLDRALADIEMLLDLGEWDAAEADDDRS